MKKWIDVLQKEGIYLDYTGTCKKCKEYIPDSPTKKRCSLSLPGYNELDDSKVNPKTIPTCPMKA